MSTDKAGPEPQRVGDSTGDNRVRPSDGEVVTHIGGFTHEGAVVLIHHTRENAHILTPKLGWIQPRILQRLPGDLQGEALLRIHGECFTGVDPEETGVEVVGVLDKPPPQARRRTR